MMRTNFRRLTEIASIAGRYGAPLRVNVCQSVRTDAFALTYEQYWEAFELLFSETDVLAAFAGDARDSHELLRETWRGRLGGVDFEEHWEAVLQKGVVPDSAAPEVVAAPRWDAVASVVDIGPLVASAVVSAQGSNI